MSFTTNFEVYAKARLRQIIAELTIDGSACRLRDYAVMLLNAEDKGIRSAMWLAPNDKEETHEWRELWRYVAEGYFGKKYHKTTYMIAGTYGKIEIDGVIVRGTGLGYHKISGVYCVDHLSSGLRVGRDFDKKKDARLFIEAMAEAARLLGLSWYSTIENLQSSEYFTDLAAKTKQLFETMQQAEKQAA